MSSKMIRWLSKLSRFRLHPKQRTRLSRRRLFVEGLEDRRLMATFEVTTIRDIVDPDDNLLSLREAITKANLDQISDSIVFNPSITRDGPATIQLNGSEIGISAPLEMIGPTSNRLTIDANHRSRIFRIDDGRGSVATNEITISNLKLTGGWSVEGGGAILSYETLIMIGCTITDSSGSSGGGIFNGGVLNLWESSLYDNHALESGGAIYNQASTLSVVDSTISRNNAGLNGGGIEFQYGFQYAMGNLVVINSTIAGNTSVVHGGGINASPNT